MSTPARRLIAHLDMDAFYASVELLRYPELQGQPVVIGGGRRHQPVMQPDGTRRFSKLKDYAGRGVITTATYAARALGVHSAMGLMKAAALAPDAVLLPVDFDQYRAYSRRFKAAVVAIAPVIEDRGIDEIYIDLSEVPGALDEIDGDALAGARMLATRLKQAVTDATGLSCSIGVTPNKLLSKLCSDLDKPDGLTLLMPEDIPRRIWPLSASRINGIGPKASARLRALGIETIGHLAEADPAWLMAQFGSHYGQWLHEAAHGRDERPVVTWREPKSLSRETTFERDLHPREDREALTPIFTRLCEQVASDLERKGYVGRTVGVKLRYDNFRIVTRSITMPKATRDATVIRQWAGRCLKTVPLDRRLRLLGVKMESLSKGDGAQVIVVNEPLSMSLFDDMADAPTSLGPRLRIEPAGWEILVAPGQSLLEAALAAGIHMPRSCRNGTCRACMCQMLSGQVSYRVAWPGLSIDEKDEGCVLPCVALPLTDVVLSVPLARRLEGDPVSC